MNANVISLLLMTLSDKSFQLLKNLSIVLKITTAAQISTK